MLKFKRTFNKIEIFNCPLNKELFDTTSSLRYDTSQIFKSKNSYALQLFYIQSLKRMKNLRVNTAVKIPAAINRNHYPWQSLIRLETARTLAFNKQTYAPPPALQTISILSKTFTVSTNVPFLSPRAIPSDGIRSGLFFLSYLLMLFQSFYPYLCSRQGVKFE